MTSSSSFELWVAQGAERVEVKAGALDPTASTVAPVEFRTDRALELGVRRPEGLTTGGRVRLGDQVLVVLPPGQERIETRVPELRDEWGEADFVYEEYDPDDPSEGNVLLRLTVLLRTRPEVEALYEHLVEDLERVHAGLAEDLLGRTRHLRAGGRARAAPLRPEEDVERLRQLEESLAKALARIGTQPSRMLLREPSRARWRPGDHVRPAAVGALTAERETVVRGRRVLAIGPAEVLRTRTTTDIGEHRQIRSGISFLLARARAVASYCERAADLYERERARWGRPSDPESSVFERRYGPRLRALDGWKQRAQSTEGRLRDLLERYDFISEAGPARTALAPTPTFLNRLGYREAYAVLREARALAGSFIGSEEVRIRYRRLSTLYEYWCFVKVVEMVRSMEGMGPPEPRDTFAVIDDVYRPELEPGQSFRFGWGTERWVTVTYEPEFPPLGRPAAVAHPFRTSLSNGTLRPDVTVTIERHGSPPTILVLDAKSVSRFEPEMLFEPTDYRTRICDPTTGDQPVRQVFFLHRDAPAKPLVNVPGYLEQRTGNRASSLLGAVPFLPDRTELARRVIERFVSIHG